MQQFNTIGFIVYLDDTPYLVYDEIGLIYEKSPHIKEVYVCWLITACVFDSGHA